MNDVTRSPLPGACNFPIFVQRRSKVIFRYVFPAKFTVSGYVRIEIWVKTVVAKLRCFCYCIPFSTCRFPSFQLSLWSSHNSMRFICTFHMCKWSNGIPLIQFSVCEFYRLNPRFVSFSRAFAMVKEKMQRSDLKYLKLITGKGWSKNKPTCDTVWKLHAPGNGLLPLIWFGSLNDGTLLLPKWNRLENFPFLAL